MTLFAHFQLNYDRNLLFNCNFFLQKCYNPMIFRDVLVFWCFKSVRCMEFCLLESFQYRAFSAPYMAWTQRKFERREVSPHIWCLSCNILGQETPQHTCSWIYVFLSWYSFWKFWPEMRQKILKCLLVGTPIKGGATENMFSWLRPLGEETPKNTFLGPFWPRPTWPNLTTSIFNFSKLLKLNLNLAFNTSFKNTFCEILETPWEFNHSVPAYLWYVVEPVLYSQIGEYSHGSIDPCVILG